MPDPGVEKTEEIDEIVAIVESGRELDDADRAQIEGFASSTASAFLPAMREGAPIHMDKTRAELRL